MTNNRLSFSVRARKPIAFIGLGPTLKSTVARIYPWVLLDDLIHLRSGSGLF